MENLNKSGIYAALCTGCDNVYVGQSRRAVCKRFGEHYTPKHQKQFGKSTPADHMLQNKHDFAGFRLLKGVNNPRQLDAYENLYICKTKRNNMNIQRAQVETSLHKFTDSLSTVDIFKMKF